MFIKGDYIVTLKIKNDSGSYNCARENYCFKQRIDHHGIYPVIDMSGTSGNGHRIMSFNKKGYLEDWRYATPQEIVKYDELGKPFDITKQNYEPSYEIY